jgi:CDP-glycerol glycerophosphotransferase (TagB/SpsB family)
LDKKAQKSWASAFGVPITKVKITGDPRGDIILSKKPKLDKYIQEIINKIKAKRIICYAPTFREGEYNFFENLNYVELDRILCEFEAILLINNHFIYGNENEDISNKLVSQRIFILDNNIFNDINKLLPFVDILITDYSSVFLDYLLLNRPMIFTPFDYDLYLKERGFYVDYFEMTPGFKCRDWNEALKELEIILNGNDEFLDKRNEIRSIYYKFIDTNNSIRVIEQAKILLNE